ncbi:MAG: hypothetical protein ACNA8G_05295 [Gammaproteobacteria bacterium]
MKAQTNRFKLFWMLLAGQRARYAAAILALVVASCFLYLAPLVPQIVIDGVEYRERALQWWQSNFGIVLQSPVLFSGSVRENIRYGRLDATDAEIVAAARLVNAHDFISELEDGYHFDVGERGSRLST